MMSLSVFLFFFSKIILYLFSHLVAPLFASSRTTSFLASSQTSSLLAPSWLLFLTPLLSSSVWRSLSFSVQNALSPSLLLYPVSFYLWPSLSPLILLFLILPDSGEQELSDLFSAQSISGVFVANSHGSNIFPYLNRSFLKMVRCPPKIHILLKYFAFQPFSLELDFMCLLLMSKIL